MEKQFLFLVVLSFFMFTSCKDEEEIWFEYTPDTFSFKEKEIEVEVSDETKSFKIFVNKDDMTKRVNIAVDYSTSSAVINEHYILPKTDYNEYGFVFQPEKKSDTFEVTLRPENIKDVVTIKFFNYSGFGNANPEKYYDTLRVKLIPIVKK